MVKKAKPKPVPKPECPTCGSDHYVGELRECPHCGAAKCETCDMGDDVPCAACENS